MRILRVLMSLLGEFVGCQVIFLAVRDGGGIVRVGCKVMKLRNSIVRTLWHGCLRSVGCPDQPNDEKHSTWMDAESVGNALVRLHQSATIPA